MTSPFAFLQIEWPEVYEAADKAAGAAHPDPRTACFYARRALELAVAWAYKSDASLRLPYQDNLSALIHEPSFKAAAGEAVFSRRESSISSATRPCTASGPFSRSTR
jgi:type I restriction enzyme R subunit